MADTGISRIDDLFNNVTGAQPIIPGDADRQAVGVVQDLLTGHGYGSMPSPQSSPYGLFGPTTKKALLNFRAKKLGLKDPNDVKADHQTLLKLVQEPATNPIVSLGYVALALGVAPNDRLRILALVSIFETSRRFTALNRNTDEQGLSYGVIQWSQRSGRLFEIADALKKENEKLFETTFGGATAAAGMLAHVKKGENGLEEDGSTNEPKFDLISPPWTTRFISAAKNTTFQKVQIVTALKAFQVTVGKIREYAQNLIRSQRGFAFQIDLSNQFGDGGARAIFNAARTEGISEAQLLEKMEEKAVERAAQKFKEAVRKRRQFFRTTNLLSNQDFQD